MLLHMPHPTCTCIHPPNAELHLDLQNPPLELTRKCVVPSDTDIQETLVPPAFPDLPLAASNKVPQAPPPVNQGICNFYMPTDSTLARFVWVVQQFIDQVRLPGAVLVGVLSRIWVSYLYTSRQVFILCPKQGCIRRNPVNAVVGRLHKAQKIC